MAPIDWDEEDEEDVLDIDGEEDEEDEDGPEELNFDDLDYRRMAYFGDDDEDIDDEEDDEDNEDGSEDSDDDDDDDEVDAIEALAVVPATSTVAAPGDELTDDEFSGLVEVDAGDDNEVEDDATEDEIALVRKMLGLGGGDDRLADIDGPGAADLEGLNLDEDW